MNNWNVLKIYGLLTRCFLMDSKLFEGKNNVTSLPTCTEILRTSNIFYVFYCYK